MGLSVGTIISSVRLCIDEEAVNDASFVAASDGDSSKMNNIIKKRIPDALRWVCLYAPSEYLAGGGSSSSSSSGSGSGSSSGSGGESGGIDIVVEKTVEAANMNENKVPLDAGFLRLIRVRCDGWHRAVMGESVLREDSDEYLQLKDAYGATATEDRPQAALIQTKTKAVEVWPKGKEATVTYIALPKELYDISEDETDINVPPLVETSFIYYLAYLLLSAWGDGRAKNMLEIATMNLGMSDDKQRR